MGKYNKSGEEILHAMPFLYGSYGYDSQNFQRRYIKHLFRDDHGEKFYEFLHRDRSHLDFLNLDGFMSETKSTLDVIACKYLRRVFNLMFPHWLDKIRDSDWSIENQ